MRNCGDSHFLLLANDSGVSVHIVCLHGCACAYVHNFCFDRIWGKKKNCCVIARREQLITPKQHCRRPVLCREEGCIFVCDETEMKRNKHLAAPLPMDFVWQWVTLSLTPKKCWLSAFGVNVPQKQHVAVFVCAFNISINTMLITNMLFAHSTLIKTELPAGGAAVVSHCESNVWAVGWSPHQPPLDWKSNAKRNEGRKLQLQLP